MKRYKLSMYNSGGYRDSQIIKTKYLIEEDAEDKLCVINNGQVIGDTNLIKEMLNEERGWIESYSIFSAERIV